MAKPSRADLAALIKVGRAAMRQGLSTPVVLRQQKTTADRKAKGRVWVSRVTLPAPAEDDICQIVLEVTEKLDPGSADKVYPKPTVASVQAQWTGFRSGVAPKEPEPAISEAEKFCNLMSEVHSPTTILYTYGGGHYINGPATRRAATAKLAELTGGRCLILQHRLAPQNPFPAQLIDALTAYLCLLYPPPNSHHSPVLPSHIVLGGDSTGAQLAISLLQIILAFHQIHGSSQTLNFHGKKVQLPVPAGLAVQSPAFDHNGYCVPSWYTNGPYDLMIEDWPAYKSDFPSDEAWPTNPPRANFYCDASLLNHPLVSPIVTRTWKSAPPMYIAVGGAERILDSAKIVAQTAANSGAAVLYDEYEHMPHNWPMVLPESVWPHTRRCYETWAQACLMLASGVPVKTLGKLTTFDTLEIKEIDVKHLINITREEIEEALRKEQAGLKPWTGGSLKAKPLL